MAASCENRRGGEPAAIARTLRARHVAALARQKRVHAPPAMKKIISMTFARVYRLPVGVPDEKSNV